MAHDLDRVSTKDRVRGTTALKVVVEHLLGPDEHSLAALLRQSPALATMSTGREVASSATAQKFTLCNQAIDQLLRLCGDFSLE